ncbi:MAG: YkgJ family cysteine cluster protein [Moraxellaceae bacterium]
MQHTLLQLEDKLPLTCSRKGTCCHGNQVLLNPWELRILALEKGIAPSDFSNNFCDWSGIRLLFAGQEMSQKKACNLYVDTMGCSVHKGRPLACRLFPLARKIQNNASSYVHEGSTFPCLSGCDEVLNLPTIAVETYLKEQETAQYERAQDAYLEVMQNIADCSFMLLLDNGLVELGDIKTLSEWNRIASLPIEKLLQEIPKNWLETLVLPDISLEIIDPLTFAQKHNDIIQDKIESEHFSDLSINKLSASSVQVMALAILLAKAIGADTHALMSLWIATAKENGARVD